MTNNNRIHEFIFYQDKFGEHKYSIVIIKKLDISGVRRKKGKRLFCDFNDYAAIKNK